MSTLELKLNPTLMRGLFFLLPLLIILLIWLGLRLAFPTKIPGLTGTRPDTIGIHAEKLAPCPNSPNCVSSFASDAIHQISPISAQFMPASQVMPELKTVILSQPRTKIITETEHYLYAEFSSAIMGYVDDVEFLLKPEENVIHVRSASRLGQSDLGVNRQRIEGIRKEFEQVQGKNSQV